MVTEKATGFLEVPGFCDCSNGSSEKKNMPAEPVAKKDKETVQPQMLSSTFFLFEQTATVIIFVQEKERKWSNYGVRNYVN